MNETTSILLFGVSIALILIYFLVLCCLEVQVDVLYLGTNFPQELFVLCLHHSSSEWRVWWRTSLRDQSGIDCERRDVEAMASIPSMQWIWTHIPSSCNIFEEIWHSVVDLFRMIGRMQCLANSCLYLHYEKRK